MKTLIIDNHTKYLEELKSLFSASEVIQKENLQSINPRDFDLVVISGGSNVPTVLRHPEEYKPEIALIKNSTVPILGICLGSELVTYSFGGELCELPENHRGEITLELTDPQLQDVCETTKLLVHEGHHIGIKSLPTNLIPCAYSEHGIEIVRHAAKPIIGLQFHPELDKNEKLIQWVFKTLKLD